MTKQYTILFLLALGLIAVFSFSAGKFTPSESKILVGDDKDEHGCIASAGFIWCPAKQICLKEWEESCQASADDSPSQEEDTPDPDTATWSTHTNQKYQYSIIYPSPCLTGPLPGYCKALPPPSRSEECLCFLNGDNPDQLLLQTYTGPKQDLSQATLSISHHPTSVFNPPADTDLITWLKDQFSHLEVPDQTNAQVAGLSAVKIYTPQSPGAYSQNDYYFFKDNLLFYISTLDVDNQDNQYIYDQIISSLSFGN